MTFKASRPTTTIYKEIWSEATRQELGLCITCHNPESTAVSLITNRPPALAAYVVTRLSNCVYILSPGVNLDDYLT